LGLLGSGWCRGGLGVYGWWGGVVCVAWLWSGTVAVHRLVGGWGFAGWVAARPVRGVQEVGVVRFDRCVRC